jgi:hypothetical protein
MRYLLLEGLLVKERQRQRQQSPLGHHAKAALPPLYLHPIMTHVKRSLNMLYRASLACRNLRFLQTRAPHPLYRGPPPLPSIAHDRIS